MTTTLQCISCHEPFEAEVVAVECPIRKHEIRLKERACSKCRDKRHREIPEPRKALQGKMR